ncbi:fimbrial protein [Klebsiella michiganensis]|nr:fimbrial protein [Klebsiella michiganensis]QTN55238.1 fimbrial protein [Klebsiella michiganensis]
MKLFSRLFLIFVMSIVGYSSVAWAGTGWCTPQGGTPTQFNYNFGALTVSDISKNSAGTSFPDAFSWNLGTTTTVSCDCDGSAAIFYFNTETSLPVGHSDGNLTYYTINDYLEGATEMYISGGVKAYLPVPIVNQSNKGTSNWGCGGISVGTGNQGHLSLYIKKPFVGTVNIPSTKLYSLYESTTSGSFGGTPISELYISGQVIVPQTCSINAGQIVTVDFGSFMSGEFKNKGQMPAGYTPKTITVPIKCNGMDANASLTLRFQAEASADEPAAIKTSNDDVGVQITDDSGKVIEPNSGLIPFQLDDNLQATVTFHAAPISTTGNVPAEGTFSATAYIRVDFA